MMGCFGKISDSMRDDVKFGGHGRTFDGCSIAGFINLDGNREDGGKIRKMIGLMRERETGLGAGFGVYGAFPDFEDFYCLQILFDDKKAKKRLQNYLGKHVKIKKFKGYLPNQ